MTNKVTLTERSLCPHHMVDIISPFRLNYTVTDFKKASLTVVSFDTVDDVYNAS